jgi:hypothetical protein
VVQVSSDVIFGNVLKRIREQGLQEFAIRLCPMFVAIKIPNHDEFRPDAYAIERQYPSVYKEED